MKNEGDVGALAIGLVISVALAALFAVLAWKYWHGQWLRSIAGNNFVPEEEYASPEQRKLGRRVSVAMIIACAMSATIPMIGFGGFLGNETLYTLGATLCGASTVALIAYIVLMFVAMSRERRNAENELMAKDPSQSENVRLDRRATIVLLVILCVFLFCVAVVPKLMGY